MSNTGTARHHMHSFCVVYVLLLFQSPCCCLPFSFIFFSFFFCSLSNSNMSFPRNPTRCKCIRRYAFPYSHPLRLLAERPASPLLLIVDLSTTTCCLPACSRGTIIINSTISNSIVSLSHLHLHSPLQLAVNLNAPWRLSLLPFYVIRFFLFSHRSTAQQQQPQHLMHSQC